MKFLVHLIRVATAIFGNDVQKFIDEFQRKDEKNLVINLLPIKDATKLANEIFGKIIVAFPSEVQIANLYESKKFPIRGDMIKTMEQNLEKISEDFFSQFGPFIRG